MVKVVKLSLEVDNDDELCNPIVYRRGSDGFLSEVYGAVDQGETSDRIYIELDEMPEADFKALPEHSGW